jgi:hypothetical protein
MRCGSCGAELPTLEPGQSGQCRVCGGGVVVLPTEPAWGEAPRVPPGWPAAPPESRIDVERIPRAPRVPSRRARELVFAYRGSQGVMLSLGLIFSAVGLLLLAFLGYGTFQDLAIELGSSDERGTVLETEVLRNVEINDQHPTEIRFKYKVDGERFEGASSTLDPTIVERARVGEKVPIEVSTTFPSVARVAGTTISAMGYVSLVFGVFAVVGLFMLLGAVRSNRREIRAFVHGTAIEADVVERGVDRRVKVNGRHPRLVRWRFEVAGRVHDGTFTHMDEAVIREVAPGDRVAVLYDPRNPRVNTLWIS